MLLEHGGVSGRAESTVEEGSEPEGFWTALGGMGEYPKVKEAEEVSQEPRLFQVGAGGGSLLHFYRNVRGSHGPGLIISATSMHTKLMHAFPHAPTHPP